MAARAGCGWLQRRRLESEAVRDVLICALRCLSALTVECVISSGLSESSIDGAGGCLRAEQRGDVISSESA